MCAVLLWCAAAQAEPLAVDERVLLRVPEEIAAVSLSAAVSPAGDRAFGVVGFADGRAAIFGPGIGAGEAGLGEPHAFVGAPVFSPDGAKVAWAWGDAKGPREQVWEIWLDGKRIKSWDWIGALAFSAGGELAYEAGDGVRVGANGWYEGGDYVMMRGKKKSAAYANFPTGPVWSPDGKKLAFVAAKPAGVVVVVEGKESEAFAWAAGLCWSADGKEVAYAAMDQEGASRIVRGKQVIAAEGEAVGAPALGGGALAYVREIRGRRELVFRDEAVPGHHDDLGTPAVSPDGKRVAVAAARGLGREESGWVFVDPAWMDGALTPEEAAGEAAAGVAPPAGQSGAGDGALGFLDGAIGGGAQESAARPGPTCYLVVDGRPLDGSWRRVVRPLFSPDSARVAARVRDEQGWRVWLDGRITAVYDQILAPRFAADGALEFGARRGREILFVRVPAPR